MSERSRNLFTYETLVHAMAGAAGSVVAMGTFYPLDTVRARLQLEDTREAKNTLSVLRELVAEEGLLTFPEIIETDSHIRHERDNLISRQNATHDRLPLPPSSITPLPASTSQVPVVPT